MAVLFKFASEAPKEVQEAAMKLLESHGMPAEPLYADPKRPSLALVFTVKSAGATEAVERLLKRFKGAIEYVEGAPTRRPLDAKGG